MRLWRTWKSSLGATISKIGAISCVPLVTFAFVLNSYMASDMPVRGRVVYYPYPAAALAGQTAYIHGYLWTSVVYLGNKG